METVHKSDCALHNEPAIKQGNCDCGAIEKPVVDFETEYQLQEFREIQGQHFDKYNTHYTGVTVSRHTAEQMLKLINQMEIEIKKHAQFVNY